MACQYDRNGRPLCQIVADPRTPNDFFCARCNTRFHKEIPGLEVAPLLFFLALGLILFLTLSGSEDSDTPPANGSVATPVLCKPDQL